MDYELAKKLKDAGFSQENLDVVWYKRDGGWESVCHDCYYEFGPFGKEEDTDTHKPNLEELIDACGDGNSYFELRTYATTESGREWEAKCADHKMRELRLGLGKTPLEAVANLWLELNK